MARWKLESWRVGRWIRQKLARSPAGQPEVRNAGGMCEEPLAMKRVHLRALLVFVLAAALLTPLLAQQAAAPQASAAQKPFVPVQDELLWKPDPADWLSWRR